MSANKRQMCLVTIISLFELDFQAAKRSCISVYLWKDGLVTPTGIVERLTEEQIASLIME